MAIAALKYKPKLKTFYATVHVTRVEEWCVEAESAEEARELLASGRGHRMQHRRLCEFGNRARGGRSRLASRTISNPQVSAPNPAPA